MTAGVDAVRSPSTIARSSVSRSLVFVALYVLLRLPKWLERIGELKRELQARAGSRLMTPAAKLMAPLPGPRYVVWCVKTKQKAVALTIDDGPHALVTPRWVPRAAKKQSYTTVLASVYPQDLRISSPDVVVDHLVRQAHEGAIIVVHDGKPERLRVAGILDAALPRLKHRGFDVLTVSELRALGK